MCTNSLFRPFSIFILVGLCFQVVNGQVEWNLTEEKENIKMYTRKLEGSKFEQVRLTTTINSSLSEIVAILEDVENQKKWMYATKKSELLNTKQSEDHFNYYLVMDMPFPAKDRDVVINYKRIQDPSTKVVTTKSKAINGILKEKSKLARITDFTSTYTLSPISNNKVQVEYFLQANPGGNLPAWMVNLFTTKGPYESMLSLVKLAESGSYKSFSSTIVD